MNFTLLIDNNQHPEQQLLSEHGISIYFEQDNYKWLLDTGNSPLFIQNAKSLGVDLTDIDFVLISHAHKDHTGGLAAFLEINAKAKVFLSANIPDQRYFSFRQGDKRDISLDFSVIEKHWHRFNWIEESAYLSENVAVITNILNPFPTPRANSTLFIEKKQQLMPDLFQHEIALAIQSDNGLLVFSGCAHNGLINTIKASADFTGMSVVKACIGGAHLPDKTNETSYESDEEIITIARQVKEQFPEMMLLTGHCTGRHAQRLLKSVLGDNMDVFYSGYTSEIK